MLQVFEKRPPFVQFDQREYGVNREESEKAGRPVPNLVDFALITPAGSKDVVEKVATEWLAMIRKQAIEGNYPPDWASGFEFRYQEWKKGNEIPEIGTPIRLWPCLTKSQIEQVIRANIRTVEELAEANEQALGLMGMGSRYYKDKAIEWLKNAESSKHVERLVNLESENRELKGSLERMQEKISELESALSASKRK